MELANKVFSADRSVLTATGKGGSSFMLAPRCWGQNLDKKHRETIFIVKDATLN